MADLELKLHLVAEDPLVQNWDFQYIYKVGWANFKSKVGKG